jgi:hypothetical protein
MRFLQVDEPCVLVGADIRDRRRMPDAERLMAKAVVTPRAACIRRRDSLERQLLRQTSCLKDVEQLRTLLHSHRSPVAPLSNVQGLVLTYVVPVATFQFGDNDRR